MSLNNNVSSKLVVEGKNLVQLIPGGRYNLTEENNTELHVVQLYVLQHHIAMMIESWCQNGENVVRMGNSVDTLAAKLYDVYKPFIEEGIDPLKFIDYYSKNHDLKDVFVLTQKRAMDTYDRKNLIKLLATNYDISRTDAGHFTYIYLHDAQVLSSAIVACFMDFEGFIGYEVEEECVVIKVRN